MNSKPVLSIYIQCLVMTFCLMFLINSIHADADILTTECCRKRCEDGCQVPYFDSSQFSNSIVINNKWLPFTPGIQFILEGTVEEKGKIFRHLQVLTVTDVVKMIDGVLTLVLIEQDFEDDQLVEEELTFVAQDDKGNVWNLGEYPEEFKKGKFIGAPSTWIAGLNHAKQAFIC